MLYALRYEETGNLRTVKSRLLESGISPQKVDLVDALLQYAGDVRVVCFAMYRAAATQVDGEIHTT